MTKHLFFIPLLLLVGSAQAQSLRYAVIDKEGTHYVRPENVDRILRDIPGDKVAEASQHLAVRALKMENGEYMLQAHVKGLGGGAIFGAVVWGTTWVAGIGAVIGMAVVEGPLALVHAPEILEATSIAANTLGLAATVAPTP